MTFERLRPPAEDLGVLVEPAGAALRHGWPDAGAALRRAALLDADIASLRASLQKRLEMRSPVIAAGHQPEFFHAGVLAKSIAAHELARRTGGEAVFIVADADVPRHTRVVLPQVTARGLRRVDVVIPAVDPQAPFELQPARPRTQWLQFFASLIAMHPFGDRALLPEFARGFLTAAQRNLPYCEAYEQALLATHDSMGMAGIRVVRLSGLCQTPAFRAFVSHVASHAADCARAYNEALDAYRKRHRVRSRGRPVPPLYVGPRGVELPFWAVRRDEPRRRLLVREVADRIELATDQRSLGDFTRAQLADVAATETPWPFEREGWHIRPRALTLSAFVRYFVADLIIHGIGGAKYDEITDDFATAAWGVPPPQIGCVSATLRLPLPDRGVRPADISAARARCRDLGFNPQRHVRNASPALLRERESLIRRAEELRARSPRDHAARCLVAREIRRVNEAILQGDPWRATEYEQQAERLAAQWTEDQIARDRTYFYALHARESLADLGAAVRRALG